MRFIFLVLLFFSFNFNCLMAQQLKALMEDKNITWIGEGYQDYVTDHSMDMDGTISRVIPLKFLNKTEADYEDFIFPTLLFDALKEGKVILYKNQDCSIPFGYQELVSIDTIISYDPATSEEKRMITRNEVESIEVAFFRLYQTYYYDSKNGKFGVKPNAMAIFIKNEAYIPERADLIDYNKYKELGWVKVTDLAKPYALEDKNINWATKIKVRETSPNIKGKDKNVKELKNTGGLPFKQYLSFLEKNKQIPIFQPLDYQLKEAIKGVDRDMLIANERVDTIVTFDPVSYAQTMNVIKHTSDEFDGITFVQNWYWNTSKSQLEIYLFAVAITQPFYDDNGNFKFRAPLFYRRNDQ